MKNLVRTRLTRLLQRPLPATPSERMRAGGHFADALYVVFLAFCLALLSKALGA